MTPLLYVGLTALLFAAVCATARRRLLGKADFFFWLLLLLAVVQEGVSFYLVRIAHMHNVVTFHFYSPAELLLTCLWFSHSFQRKSAKNWVVLIGLVGCIVSVLNSVFLQSFAIHNTHFLLVESAIICLLSVFRLFELLAQDNLQPYRMASFWITLNLLFYWSSTLVAYGVIGFHPQQVPSTVFYASLVLVFSNILFYTSLGIIFLRYKKLIPSGA